MNSTSPFASRTTRKQYSGNVTWKSCPPYQAWAEASDVLLLRDYNALRALCGAAPATKRSGKLYLVVRRHAVNPRLQQAIHHWARTAVQHDPVSKAKYTALRARGHRHTRALRSVADRLLKVTCTMLKNQQLFDHNYLKHELAA